MTDNRTLPGDLALRRALDHAPDRAAAPGEELGRAILGFAHEAVAPSLPGAKPGFFGHGRGRVRSHRRRRNTALAALLIGVLALATWQRELMPGARPHVEVPATAPISAATPDAAQRTLDAGAPPAAPSVPASGPESAFLPGFSPSMPPAPAPAPAPELARPAGALAPKVALPVPVPGLAAAPAAVPTPPAALSKSPLPASPSAVTVLPGPSANAPAERVAAVLPGRAGATPAVTVRTAETPPPSFAALSQWTHLTLTRPGGESRTRPRPEVRELGALLGSAALAGVGPEALKTRVDWRIALQRNGETIARIELAGSQVRWRENGTPPGTGTPPPGALAGLRGTLEAVFEESTAGGGAPATPARAGGTTPQVPPAPDAPEAPEAK